MLIHESRRARRASGRLLAPALATLLAATLAACALVPGLRGTGGTFTLAVVPDTQNYMDHTHQREAGFAIEAADLFLEQMEWLAQRSRTAGGEIAFVASVGDVWQHPSLWIDPEHEAMGIRRIENPFFGKHFDPTERVREIEMPIARAGYRLLAAADLPFGVAPGNHDYDAMYNVSTHPPNLAKPPAELTMTAEDIGLLHTGGLTNFISIFGAESEFYGDEPWYVGAYDGGTSSAQLFEAGGYTFLHLAIEMQAGDEALAWARGMIARYPGLPTIVSTHDYLSPRGTRVAGGFLDLTLVDGQNHNTPDQIFEKLIDVSDQIFLVLCGHYHGQAHISEMNQAGHDVDTILADYQDRGQVGIDAGQPPGGMMGGPVGLGDGWLRLLRFDTTMSPPTISVRTYSTHYEKYSDEMPEYVAWYRDHEQPDMSDEEFLAAEAFEIVLDDFTERFGTPAR